MKSSFLFPVVFGILELFSVAHAQTGGSVYGIQMQVTNDNGRLCQFDLDQNTSNTRKVALRMAIVLGAGGVLIPYFNLLKFGLGGKQGNGKQMFSWVHIEDACRMTEWIANNDTIEGVYNCSSPGPVTNQEFMKTLRNATGNKIGLPAYTWMLKIGAALIGTETELILKSRWVLPAKILETGFTFKYPLLKDALADIIGKVPRKQYHLF